MNGAMNIQKVFSPISPTHRVGRLKKEHPDSQKKRFEGDLDEQKDGDKNEKQGIPILETTKASGEKGKRKEGKFKNGLPDPSADMKKHDSSDVVGALVDIRV